MVNGRSIRTLILGWLNTLAGRVTLSLLVSLLTAQVASIFVLVDQNERQRVRGVTDTFFAQTESLEKLLNAVPDEDPTVRLSNLSRQGMVFWVSSQPTLEPGMQGDSGAPAVGGAWAKVSSSDKRVAWYRDVRPFWMHYRFFDPEANAPRGGPDGVPPENDARPPGAVSAENGPPPNGPRPGPPREGPPRGGPPDGPPDERFVFVAGGGLGASLGPNGGSLDGLPRGGAGGPNDPGRPPAFGDDRPPPPPPPPGAPRRAEMVRLFGDAASRAPRTGPNAPSVRWRASLQLENGRWLNAEDLQLAGLPPWINVIIEQNLIMLAVMGASILLVVGVATKRLTLLAVAADRVGRGETLEPIPESGTTEVRHLTQSFNTMSLRLRRFIEGRTQMLGAISHDLRTPITGLRLRADLVDDEENRDRMLAIVDEIHHLTEATLALAKEESFTEVTDRVDLSSLIESICDDLTDVGIDVSCDVERGVNLTCRPFSLRRAIRNLAENGAKYGNRSRIGMTNGSGNVCIVVDDDGPGIPDDQLQRVLLPFVRLESSRSRATGGAGLGLAITRSIILNHGGELELKNRPEGGLRATITLPTAA